MNTSTEIIGAALHYCENCDYEEAMEENPCGNYLCESCEQDRKNYVAKREKEKEEKIEKLNKAIVERWEFIKKDTADWVNGIITDKQRFTDDVERREDVIRMLNVMCNELGQFITDEYEYL